MSLSRLKLLSTRFLLVNTIRGWVAKARFLYLVKLRKRLRTLQQDNSGVATHTVQHNLKGLADLIVSRSTILIRPLSVIEGLGPDSKVLSIGPRTEGEILNLIAHGFALKNIRGLDLISYSPWIELGNMHAMPYPDGAFDVVIMGWVLAYSDTPHAAAAEVARVTRDGGVIAVGVEYNPLSDEQIRNMVGYIPGSDKRIESVDAILRFFGDRVDQVYFRHDVAPSRRHEKGSLCAIFSVKKGAGAAR